MHTLAAAPRSLGSHRIPLDSGRWVTIRPIESSDGHGLLDFYRRLSARARYTRFLGIGPGVDAEAAQRFADVDHDHADGFVAVLHEAGPQDGAIIGHLCMEPDRGGSEEVAVAVADGQRGRGIGSALFAAAVRSAARRGVPRLSAMLFATNEPMRRLLLHAPCPRTDRIDAGIETIELELARDGKDGGMPCAS
ncbi:MAG TPA: GNAT family N-acetyltransferase [Candidatus Limnocylindria bacterium]|nr:GNAT family N-acetyltransferase [Candidatus Limnocylindria bacterium]